MKITKNIKGGGAFLLYRGRELLIECGQEDQIKILLPLNKKGVLRS